MKSFVKIPGFAVLAAAALFIMTTCCDGLQTNTPSELISLLEAPSPSSVQSFEGAPVANWEEAGYLFLDLLDCFPQFLYTLTPFDDVVFSTAFEYIKGVDFETYIAKSMQNKNGSYSLSFSDTEMLKSIGTVTEASIKGSNKGSYGSNKILCDLLTLPMEDLTVGDKISISDSASRTFNINNGFVELDSGYNISGIIKIETDFEINAKLSNKTHRKFDAEAERTTKYAVTVAFFDGGIGAKYSFSYSVCYKLGQRSINDSITQRLSDVNVYDNDNKLLCTLPLVDWLYDWNFYMGSISNSIDNLLKCFLYIRDCLYISAEGFVECFDQLGIGDTYWPRY